MSLNIQEKATANLEPYCYGAESLVHVPMDSFLDDLQKYNV